MWGGGGGGGRAVLGICLGMQLLAEESHENGVERGLAIVPGRVVSMGKRSWHIGWNTITTAATDPLFADSDGQAFYFNHSYVYEGPKLYQAASCSSPRFFAAAVRRERIVGVQFHPEKSQLAGRALLKRIIVGLADA